MDKKNILQLSKNLWEIPKNTRFDMKVPARIYASEKMLEEIIKDKSLDQLINLTTLLGIEKYSIVMPDVHEGYGSPIGGVFATKISAGGIISPGAVGYDINCGVRLLLSEISEKDIKEVLPKLAHEIQRNIPSGVGRGRADKMLVENLDKLLEGGVKELEKKGFANREDVENCESGGCLEMADASKVSDLAKKRGLDQSGTLGSGNHFLEIQKVEKIFDAEIAKSFGIFEDQVVIMIHTGSRGLGHQIATDYIRLMLNENFGIDLVDKELACAPFNTQIGQDYFAAMSAGANFAWANRQMITHYLRESWDRIISKGNLKLLYDVAHNICKIEEHDINGKIEKLLVHRKGATRAFPPGNTELAKRFIKTGQPVIIPGSMGTSSYVLSGTNEAKESFYSSCHGAGRTMSRHGALKIFNGREIVNELQSRGIIVESLSMRGIAEEAPGAYKNVDDVIEVVSEAGLAHKVAKLVPIAVVKGE